MNKNRLKTLLILLPLLAALPAWGQFDNAFQSTSTMQGSGSPYASDPSINGNGMVEQPAAIPNRGRTTLPGDGTGTTEVQNNNPGLLPLGSAVPALLLLAGGYAAIVAYRKRKVE